MSNNYLAGFENVRTKYDIIFTTHFKKDFKLAVKRGLNLKALASVIVTLASGESLPERNKDHELTGDRKGYRECHILPDWLLIYKIENNTLVLTLARTGTHSDLFSK